MKPFYTENSSEISRLEGLYIMPQNPPAQVQGVSLNGVGIIGETLRGPVNVPVEIGDQARFLAVFGGRDDGLTTTLRNLVWKALLNKKFGQLVVVRVTAAAAVAADFTTETAAGGGGTAVCKIAAANVGIWGNMVKWKVGTASDANANHFDLYLKYEGTIYRLRNLSCYSSDDNLAEVVAENWDSETVLVTLTKSGAGRPVNSAPSTDGADADGYTYLGQVVSAFASTPGAEGSIADGDFTATGGAMEQIAVYPGVAIVFAAERNSATLDTKWKMLAAASNDRLFLVGADAYTTAKADGITDAGGFSALDRCIYCFNHPYTLDPDLAVEVVTSPTSWMAAILSQTDVDVHPGAEETKRLLAGIIRLYSEGYSREDYIAMREAGMCVLEHEADGFSFVSGVTTLVADGAGTEQITRRRMADYLITGAANLLKHSVKAKNTIARRAANKGALGAWLTDLAKRDYIVDKDPTTEVPLFLVDTEVLNTPAQRAAGIEKIYLKVKIIGHALYLVLVPEIGTTVEITEVAA